MIFIFTLIYDTHVYQFFSDNIGLKFRMLFYFINFVCIFLLYSTLIWISGVYTIEKLILLLLLYVFVVLIQVITKCWRLSISVCGVDTGHYQVLETQYKQAFSTMQEQKDLITQLEEDLRSVNAVSSMFRGDAEVSLV